MGKETGIRIKVIKGRESWWYNRHVGEEFRVFEDRDKPSYYTLYRPIDGTDTMMAHGIKKEDTEIII